MAVTHSFQTLFAVPMTCDGCVKAVSDALYRLEGITKVEATLADQLVRIEGTAAPSAIVEAIQDAGKDAILRGSGASNSAAVSILETYSNTPDGRVVKVPSVDGNWISPRRVRGLTRMVQVSPTTTVLDLNIRGIDEGTYHVTIRAYGDLSRGVSSTGSTWKEGDKVRGDLGTLTVDKEQKGNFFVAKDFEVWEVIGHALVVTKQVSSIDNEGKEKPLENDENTVLGVIARSAGVWDNDKTVCSCTGKTLWEERKEEVKRGMI